MSDSRALLLVFLGAFMLCALVTKTHVVSWNDGSRIATVDALTADRTFQLDASPYAVRLGDKMRFRGRTYSDKPPLLALLAAGVAVALAPFGLSLRHNPGPTIYLMTLFTVGACFAAGCCYAYALQRLLGFSQRVAAGVAALSGAGTLALPYATLMANHVPVGAAAIGGYYHLVRSQNRRPADIALAGLLFGLAYAFDAAGLVVVIGAAVLLWGAPVRLWCLCAATLFPLVALQMLYNVSVSGSVIPPAFNPGVWADPALPLHSVSQNLYRALSPVQYAEYVAYLTVGGKGLFSYTPLMLVAAYGFWPMLRRSAAEKRLAVAVLATFAVYFALLIFLQEDYSARNFGERRYVELFFLLCIPLGAALTSAEGKYAAAAIRLAIVASVAIASLGTIAPFGGHAGENGFHFAGVAFAELTRRAIVQAAVDVVFLALLIAGALWLVELPPASPALPRVAGD